MTVQALENVTCDHFSHITAVSANQIHLTSVGGKWGQTRLANVSLNDSSLGLKTVQSRSFSAVVAWKKSLNGWGCKSRIACPAPELAIWKDFLTAEASAPQRAAIREERVAGWPGEGCGFGFHSFDALRALRKSCCGKPHFFNLVFGGSCVLSLF